MKSFFLAFLLAFTAPFAALADDGSDTFKGFGVASSVARSGIVNVPQRGDWSAGAMTESYSSAAFRETETGVKLDTGDGSRSEAFGDNFRGRLATGGEGRSFGGYRVRGRF